ncbi:wax ester/triacylglycerol synthase family O-acyltransferase [Spongiibacter taiwanensis]|uniref:wax ester/triacylglycerol synthase family O-acyltransferase n=1 Tax=Spongiibacter taiwanensis TaxID=1748242 RepID=UPI0020363097|nr:wax ester/triacylglycerol synthase family O-acyltransferase [Spongiibacter taiwanensis]USA42721.1 wax ester/triacylglycerol synthase family O-acyltransferase [Spongiibacter taiwanensis]
MKQLKPQDAQFLYMETENNLSNATMVCIYALPDTPGFDPFEATLEQLDAHLHMSTIFTHHIKQLPGNLDYPYWVVDPYFLLQNHVFHAPAEAPGDWSTLRKMAAGIHSQALDLRRPPWEVHVITGLKNLPDCPDPCFALVTKIHHAAIDGTSAMRFFRALHENGATATTKPVVEAKVHEAPGRGALMGNATRNFALSPIKAIAKLLSQSKSIAAGSEAPQSNPRDTRSPVPLTRFNGEVGAEKSFSGVRFPLAEMKSLRNLAPGATLNDVVMAICGGALHRYLDAHNELPNTPLAAWVPINARPKGSRDIDGNNISAMAIKIASQISDPVERLQRISLATQDAKLGRSGTTARLITDLTQHIPAAGMAVLTRVILGSSMTAKMCNLAISNVPGAAESLYLKGAKCLQQFGMVPLGDGMGLFVVAMSYDGYMSLSITSTEAILPDMDFFTECLQAEFDALLATASAAAATPAKKPARRGRKPKAEKANSGASE